MRIAEEVLTKLELSKILDKKISSPCQDALSMNESDAGIWLKEMGESLVAQKAVHHLDP
jgi:hypothetical protein